MEHLKKISSLSARIATSVLITAVVSLGVASVTSGAAGASQASASAGPWAIVAQSPAVPRFSASVGGASILGSSPIISCPTTTFCMTVGTPASSSGVGLPLIEVYRSGVWSEMAAAPLPSDTLGGGLDGVSCVSTSFCVAVGGYNPGGGGGVLSLVEKFNGTSWSLMPSPNPANSYVPFLVSVSCTSTTFCVAVGSNEFQQDTATGLVVTIVETFNGASWSLMPSPNLPEPAGGNGMSVLTSVSCVSTTFCVAGGWGGPVSGTQLPLIETFNGSSWSITPIPAPPNPYPLSVANEYSAHLESVSCASPSFCVAVGFVNGETSSNHSVFGAILTEAFNGSSWSITQNPYSNVVVTNRAVLFLGGVSCTSPSYCVAVGSNGLTLIETYNGSSWSITPSPDMSTVPGSGNILNAVSCASSSACAAIGSYNFGSYSYPVPSCPLGSTTQAKGNLVVATGPLQASKVPSMGYWTVASDGGIFSYGNARFLGSMGGRHLNAPMVAMAATPDGKGYWTVASDGGIFSYGNAIFHGSMGGRHLNAPMVGIATGPGGCGYWTVAADGGIFSYGSSVFHGSMGGKRLNAPVVAMASTPGGNGYWLVAADGGVFTFGSAVYHGSMGGKRLNSPIIAMAPTPDGGGYLLVAADGGVFVFGDAVYYGSQGGRHLNAPMVAIASTPDAHGYWTVATDGGVFSYGDARFYGSMGGRRLDAPMVGIAST